MADTAPTASDLLKQAQQETQTEVSSQIAPLQTDIGDAQAAMGNALSGLSGMFGNLLPYVKGSAERVANTYAQSLAQEKGIFEEATARLGNIRAQRAAEAQGMAQKIGGPVAVDAYLAPLNTSLAEMPNAQATTLLHSNALTQGGVQEAEAFAGRVFPLLQAEQAAQLRNTFQQRITDTQKEIERIRAASVGKTQTRLDELLQREREYKLQQDQLALDRLKADRDWQTSKLDLAQRRAQITNDRANLLGYYDKKWRDKQGRLHTSRIQTLGARQLSEQTAARVSGDTETVRHNIAAETIDQATIDQRNMEQAAATKANNAAIAQTQRENAAKYIDAVMTPGTTTITTTRYDEIPANAVAGTDKSKLIPRTHVPGHPPNEVVYFKATKVTEPVTTSPLNDPQQIYKYLVAHAIPPAIAKAMVQKRFNFDENWKPRSNPGTITLAQIDKMDFNTLRKEALKRGWEPDPNHPATGEDLRDWLKRYQKMPTGVGAQAPEVPPNPRTGGSPGTKRGQPVPEDVVWDPTHKYWYNTSTGKVWLKGHPPNRSGKPS